jgi:hypothetical protein
LRSLRVNRGFNRKLGQVTAFSADGTALDAKKLAKCNG